MKLARIVLILILLVACKTDQEIALEAQKQADEQFKSLDQSSIDAYPLFEDCDELENSPTCFYNNLQSLINDRLAMCDLDLKIAAKDSVVASISVLKSGQIIYDSIISTGQSPASQPKIDSLLRSRLKGLPTIQSALKQDIPVKTSYRLPVVITPAPYSDQ
jgi:hypothetical protein